MENFNKKRSPVRQTRTDISKEELIQKMMLKKKLKSQISKYSSKVKMKEGYCPQHKKPNEVYCLKCLEKICTNCALFGSHKVK